MTEVQPDGTSPSRGALAVAVGLHFLVLPGVLLLALFASSIVLDISFGTLVIVLTGVTLIVLLSGSGWGQRSAAASRTGVLIQRADQAYVADVSEGRTFDIPVFTRGILVLTASTAIGWLLLIGSYLGYLPKL